MKTGSRSWLVAACATGVNLSLGMLNGWSVFAAALVHELGFTKTEALLPYTVAFVTMSFLMILGGRLQDLYGPRLCVTLGGVMAGAGMIAASFAASLPVFVLSFGFLTGAGIGIGHAATIPAAVSWFPQEMRGRVSGLVVAGVGLSAVYVAPLTHVLVTAFGVKRAFWLEGLFFLAAVVVLAQFLSVPLGQDKENRDEAGEVNYAPRQVLGMPAFWLVWLMFACSAVAGQMIIGHLAIIAQVQAKIAWGFVFVVLLAIFNTFGRLCGGFLSDRLGRKKVLLLAFAVQALNMLFFNFYTTPFLLAAGIVIAGLAYGSLFALFPPLTYDIFGLKNGGANYGLVFTACGAAGMAGPYLAGRIVDASGSYSAAYLVASSLLAVSMALCTLLPKILLRGTPAKELLPPLS